MNPDLLANIHASGAWLINSIRIQCRCSHPSAQAGKKRVWECSNCGNLVFAANV